MGESIQMSSCSQNMSLIFKKLFDLKDGQINPYESVSVAELAYDRVSLDRIVLQRLQSITDHANRNSSYYKQLFADRYVVPSQIQSFDDFKSIPFLTRDDLKNNLELISTTSNRQGWVKSSTGGTTSSPISYYRDQHSTWRRIADTANIDAWYGRRLGDRVAYIWGATQDFTAKPTLGMRLRNYVCHRTLMLPSAPLDQTIMEQYLQRLDKWRPSFLQAYPTPLYEFCLFLRQVGKGLPYLKSASVTAEPLYSHHRELIEEILGFKVFNWYGSRELGRIASECECHNGLHINEPSVYVEVEQDRTLPEGCGHLIVTDLWNTATPFIRYQTGDIAKVVEGECSCGRALKRIASIEGRLTDMILLTGGRKIAGVSLTNRVIKDFSEINELQIIQKELTKFHIRYVKGPKFKASTLNSFKENFCGLVASDIVISFEELLELPREKSGKIRFVKSEITDLSGSILTSASDQREEFHV